MEITFPKGFGYIFVFQVPQKIRCFKNLLASCQQGVVTNPFIDEWNSREKMAKTEFLMKWAPRLSASATHRQSGWGLH